MELSDLTPANLSELIELIDKKKSLTNHIDRLDAEMIALIKGKSSPKSPAKPRATRAVKSATRNAAPAPATEKPSTNAGKPVRAKRGALKEGILAALETAGPDGVSVGDLASRLGVEAANIHVWFSTTGKKLPGLTKIAPGRYALGAIVGAAVAEPAAAIIDHPPVPEPVALPEEFSAPAPLTMEPEIPEPVAEESFDAPTTVEPVAEDAPAPKDEDYLMLSPD